MSPLPYLVIGGLTAPLLASLLDALPRDAQVHSASLLSVCSHLEHSEFVLPSTITYIVQKAEELCWGANSPPILRDSWESACLGCMHCDRSVAYVLKSCCTSTPLIQCLCTQSYASA